MDEKIWITYYIRKIKRTISINKNRLEVFKYDEDTLNMLKAEIDYSEKALLVLEKQVPEDKIHEYGGAYKCLRCGCEVNQYAKYCHYCGQRFNVKNTAHEGLEGWCAEK